MTVAIAMLIFLLSVMLAATGVRGRRVGADETCRRCGYHVRGRSRDAADCAECGAPLDRPKAIFRGRRRPWLALQGVVALLAGAATFGLERSGRLENNRLLKGASSSYLLWLARHGKPDVRSDSIDRLLSRYRWPAAYPADNRLSPS